YLVDHDEVIARRCQGKPVLGDETGIEQSRLHQPGPVALEQIIEAVPRVRWKNRLPDSERGIGVAAQDAAGFRGNDAAHLFERLMRIDIAESIAHSGEPGGKVAPRHLAAGRHAQGLQKFAIAEKRRILTVALEAV